MSQCTGAPNQVWRTVANSDGSVTIEQNGKTVLDHVYGLTSNLKIWANERRGTPGCSDSLNRVCQFVCGPESNVWEGLSPGTKF